MNENGNGNNLPFESWKAAAYIRVSSANQNSLSGMDGQRNAIQGFASKHGLKIVCFYEAFGSGHGAESVCQRLLEDVQSGGREFDMILVYQHSRLTRDRGVFLSAMNVFEDQGIPVVSVNEPVSSAVRDDFLDMVNEALREFPDSETTG